MAWRQIGHAESIHWRIYAAPGGDELSLDRPQIESDDC